MTHTTTGYGTPYGIHEDTSVAGSVIGASLRDAYGEGVTEDDTTTYIINGVPVAYRGHVMNDPFHIHSNDPQEVEAVLTDIRTRTGIRLEEVEP